MLRALYSAISGLRSHQTMLDVTGNNIANVNTTGFKSSAARFQDTLSQLTVGPSGPQEAAGGSNPAQIGLGVRVAAISTNFSQGSAQATTRATDMMISGEGFFTVQSGGENLYTRAGSFSFDGGGRLVTADGALVQGWTAVAGVIPPGNTVGQMGNVLLPPNQVSSAIATTLTTITGNLPNEAAVGENIVRNISVYDVAGDSRNLAFTFTRTAGGWNVAATDGVASASASLVFTAGVLTSAGAMSLGGVVVDFSALSGFAKLTTVAAARQNGREPGTLQSFSVSKDGTIIGSFTNGATEAIARLALAKFVNPAGLEQAGASTYRATINSGDTVYGAAGTGGMGRLQNQTLEMSNVDLSQEFTNLIVAQRGFQANARIITTTDEVLQELTNLKR